VRLHDHVVDRLKSDDVRSEPYPIPRGYKAHSVPMIMLNVTQELAETLEELRHRRSEEFVRASVTYMTEVLKTFQKEDGRITELVPKEEGMDETLLSRHVNPGHSIESMWFVMKTASKSRRDDCIERAVRALKRTFDLGWDQEHGGLFRFVDCNGGKPKGNEPHSPYEQQVLDTWDMKLWWPHSEALYATLLAYELTGDSEFLTFYDRTHNYVFRIFPNPDPEIGEWIQIRDRVGHPVNKIVALPLKDTYHILRDIFLIIELLSQKLHSNTF
jgi:N-acylglucosamine 2-epimerase